MSSFGVPAGSASLRSVSHHQLCSAIVKHHAWYNGIAFTRAVFHWRGAMTEEMQQRLLIAMSRASPSPPRGDRCERCKALRRELHTEKLKVSKAEERLADELMRTEYEWCQRELVIEELTSAQQQQAQQQAMVPVSDSPMCQRAEREGERGRQAEGGRERQAEGRREREGEGGRAECR